MDIMEDKLIGKGFIVAIMVIGLVGVISYKTLTPDNGMEILKELLPYFGMAVAFYLGNRGSNTSPVK